MLRTLYARGPLARVELATAIGAPRATIGQIVQPLLDTGLLEELEPRASAALGGRRARPLWFSRSGWVTAGVHLLPGLVRAAGLGAGGEVFAEAERRFDQHEASREFVVDQVVAVLEEVLTGTQAEVRGVGIAVAGLVDTDRGEVIAVNLMPQLEGLDLADQVAQRVNLAVYVDQHPRAQALGDMLFGDARAVASFVSLYTGEALGAGLIVNGRLHRGAGGAGGEVGHSFVDVNGAECHCGQRGCWETLATLTWLRRRAGELGIGDAEQMTAERACQLAAGGLTEADTLLGEYRRHLSYGIANLQQTIAPELFLLHGDVAGAGEEFREALESEVAGLVPGHPGAHPRIVLADRDDHVTVRGAASIALFQTLDLGV